MNGMMHHVDSGSATDPTDFIFIVDTTVTSGTDITLPLPSGYIYDCYVNYGDGTGDLYINAYNSSNASHTYTTGGLYTVVIKGDCPAFTVNNTSPFKQRIVDVIQWGKAWYALNMYGTTLGVNTSGVVQATDTLNLSNITNTTNMFRNCGSLVSINRMNEWNVATITNMTTMFRDSSSFNQDLNGWDVSSVTDMTGMFYLCSAFNGNISSWNVSSCKEFNSMFTGCTSFNQNLNSWDVSSALRLDYMFSNCSSFNQPLGNWVTRSAGVNMIRMLNGCSSYNQDLSGMDISGATNMNEFGTGANFSTANYDAMLNAWSLLTLKSGVSFGINAQYTIATSGTARASIISTYGWTITDGGGI